MFIKNSTSVDPLDFLGMIYKLDINFYGATDILLNSIYLCFDINTL